MLCRLIMNLLPLESEHASHSHGTLPYPAIKIGLEVEGDQIWSKHYYLNVGSIACSISSNVMLGELL
jgi:hypothetical protein